MDIDDMGDIDNNMGEDKAGDKAEDKADDLDKLLGIYINPPAEEGATPSDNKGAAKDVPHWEDLLRDAVARILAEHYHTVGPFAPHGPPGKPVLVTTEHRGVFFGYLASELKKEMIGITDARCVVSWTASTKGFLGLASDGPGDGCRIGPQVRALVLYDITSVTECSEEAVARFELAPWA